MYVISNNVNDVNSSGEDVGRGINGRSYDPNGDTLNWSIGVEGNSFNGLNTVGVYGTATGNFSTNNFGLKKEKQEVGIIIMEFMQRLSMAQIIGRDILLQEMSKLKMIWKLTEK